MRYLFFCGQDILFPAPPGGSTDGATGGRLGASAPSPEELSRAALGRRDFEDGGESFAALMLDEEGAREAQAAGMSRSSLREALAERGFEEMRPALRGMALLRWLEGARFCGGCGAPLEDGKSGDYGRVCGSCGRIHFPRISPAVIVLVRRGERALLAHNARFKPGQFGLIAGFVEAGETLEEAVVREVREEAGIEIDDLRYAKSQPWPFPDSLMVAFTARYVSGETRPDGAEIDELRWCLPTELPRIPPRGSVARYLLDEFVKGSNLS